MSGEKGPWVNAKGTRYDPKSTWAFGRGYFGPPDLRPSRRHPRLTNEKVRMWLPHDYNPGARRA